VSQFAASTAHSCVIGPCYFSNSKHTLLQSSKDGAIRMTISPQSKGGKKRADSLSPEERTEIASLGAAARWSLPKATHEGEREVAGYTIPVYNLPGDLRYISERGFLAIIGAKGRGAPGGHRLRQIIGAPVVKSFFSDKLVAAIESPVKFLSTTNSTVSGYTAETLKDFCISFSKAKNKGAIRTSVQIRYAEYCEALIYAFAEMGINYWIDEATGFQKQRARESLNKILEKYIANHWAKWAQTFPDEFYEHIYRLKKLPYDPDNVRRPGFIGRLTTDIVYARLAPGVLDELQKKNPVLPDTKRRRHKHHQWLTHDFGVPKLKEHIGNVIFTMKQHNEWSSFYRRLQRGSPKLHETAEFDFGDDI
jgi:hypothetical protein